MIPEDATCRDFLVNRTRFPKLPLQSRKSPEVTALFLTTSCWNLSCIITETSTTEVSYDPRFIHSTRRWSRLAGNIQVLALPFSTQIRDRVVPHTFVQPIDCLMPNPRRELDSRNLWVEGKCDRTFPDTPGTCAWLLSGSEPATCLRTRPAGRKFTLPPPLRQDAYLRPDRKPHLWSRSSMWDP